MPRHRHKKKLTEPPLFKGYRPYGTAGKKRPPVELLFEEYEALKLADYQLMAHHEACRHMGISRPTFARIYENARRKMAKALVECREITTARGSGYFDEPWYLCRDCHNRFQLTRKKQKDYCPSCESSDLESMNP